MNKELNYGRHHIDRFVRHCYPFEKVLDIGAGQGKDLDICAKVKNQEVEFNAIECFEPNVQILNAKNIITHNLNIENTKFPFKDEYFDIIIANQVLEHTKELFWILHEVTRGLKVGGKFIIGVPNLAAIHNRLLLLFGIQPTCIKNNSAHVRGYTKMDMCRLINSVFPHGFELKMFAGSNTYPFPKWCALPLTYIFPTLSISIFFCFEKIKAYKNHQILKYPTENKLETNFYTG